MANFRYQSKHSNYWSEIIDGITEEAKRRGTGIVIISESNSLTNVLNVSKLMGIIIVGYISPELCMEIKQFNTPIVLVDHEEPLLEADSIFMDNFDGLLKITNYLIAMGHNKLIFVGDLNYSKSFYDRWLGFRTSLEKANLYNSKSQNIFTLNYTSAGWIEEFDHWIESAKEKNKLPSAFVCANDNIAHNIIDVLKRHNFKLPEDFSITGYDNLDSSSYVVPSLTTCQVFKKFLGKRAVSKMFWRIKHQEYYPEKVLINGEIIIRDSVAPPNPE
nr:substrate-binding domain-containing protein [Pullulanibacillus pueri]